MDKIKDLKYVQYTKNIAGSGEWTFNAVICNGMAYTNLSAPGFISKVLLGKGKPSCTEEELIANSVMVSVDAIHTKYLVDLVYEFLTNTAQNKKRYFVMDSWRRGLEQSCDFHAEWYAENELHFENGFRVNSKGEHVYTEDEKTRMEMYAACD